MASLLAAALAFAGCGGNETALTKSGLNPADFDSEYNGAATALYTLTNDKGMEVCITNFGGRIVSVMVPDKEGNFKDVVLGFDKVSDYFPENNASDFGASIGRYANRLNQGLITIDGKEYDLPKNNFGHCLHGGPQGWQYQVYEVVESDSKHLQLRMESPDGDMNFPGNVEAFVTFTLTDDNSIDIAYDATTDAPTVINMTNHSYFNLAGDPAGHSVCEDYLLVNASSYTPVDATYMTTGEIASVEGTPFDFREAKLIGQDIAADNEQIRFGNGYDHNWVLDTKGDFTQEAASVYCPATGILLQVYTDEPGIQIYTGNFLDGTVTGKHNITYQQRTAICLETQHYPDTPNKSDWPSAVVRPGDVYTSHCAYRFSVK